MKALDNMEAGPESYLEHYLFEEMDLAEWIVTWWHNN